MIVPILLIGLALIFAYIGSRKQLSKVQLLIVLLFFAIGAAGVLFQDLTMRVAAYFNVGRGADLLLYFSVLCGVLVAANFYFRFKELERTSIEIVRRLAILSPVRPPDDSAGK
jgi:small membrane protein